MGQRESTLQPRAVEDLMRMTDFSSEELNIWYKEFEKDARNRRLSKSQFNKIFDSIFPNSDATHVADHVFRSFDTNKDGVLNFREFVIGLSLSFRGTLDEKIYWVFNICDVDGNGYVTEKELTEILSAIKAMCREKNLEEPPVDNFFNYFDINHDGKVSWAEFRKGFLANRKLTQYLFQGLNCVAKD